MLTTVATILGMVLGSGLIIVSGIVYFRYQKFGAGGSVMTVFGMLLVTLSIWQYVNISITPKGGIKAELTKMRKDIKEGFQKQETLIEEVAQVAHTLDLLQVTLHEPSGLTKSHLSKPTNPIVLAVDDEQHGIFILEGTTKTIKVHGPIRFKFDGFKGKDPDDLEGICYNGTSYFAITSHRRLGENKQGERRLVKFNIGTDWKTKNYAIPLEADDVRDLSKPLGKFLKNHGVIVDQNEWSKKYPDDPHPYALEIEGLACDGGNLFLGLKWPLHKGNALLVEYNWLEKKFIGGVVHLDLGSKGISGMFYHSDRNLLIVAANPPVKVYDTDGPEVAERYFGSSDLYVFQLEPSTRKLTLVKKLAKYSRHGAKLEGVTIVDNDLWLAYDGRKPAVLRKPLREHSIWN